MNVVVIGSGMMGRAIAYDLHAQCNFKEITIVDKDKNSIQSAKEFLKKMNIKFLHADVEKTDEMRKILKKHDIAISAIPYIYNYNLAKLSIEESTNFLDLGGNNEIVTKERDLFHEAKNAGVTIIPDCGLAPGLVSIITKDIVDHYSDIEFVKIRVGGLPVNPKPPLNYQIVFSPNGLINEYIEDAAILDNGKIIKKKAMTEIETITFPDPFGEMEAFITSGGCSSLPFTYKNKIKFLDYKTIRYKGHCEKFKTILDLGFGNTNPLIIKQKEIIPRDVLIHLLEKTIPNQGKDVVLLKVICKAYENEKPVNIEYTMIDYYDESTKLSAMMRTTGFPVSIIADLITRHEIKSSGVFCSEEIVPTKIFFKEMQKRNIKININKK
jgi:lysine 6-dehydrogenase